MIKNNTSKHLPKTEYLCRLITMLLCLSLVLSVFSGINIPVIRASDNAQAETRQEIKAHLMDMIRNEDWDPYSADMTIEEFYALMELFDEGKLPLQSTQTIATSRALSAQGLDEPSAIADDTYIPREKFLFAGLNNYVRRDGSDDNASPLDYDNINGAVDEPENYPAGLDPYNSGYMRPPATTWDGIEVTDTKTNRVVLVSEDANADDPAVAGNVIQDFFAKYTGYYIKQVTIDGANINVLGVINLGNRYIYYYLSAEGQNTQVSTTTLPDEAKFIIEYVPVEHQIKYQVKLEDENNRDITNDIPENVVFYGSNSPTKVSWVNSIFGSSPPKRTTDGAYSFDVVVPYGYELKIFISIEMTVDIPYARETNNQSFHVEIDHTGTKENVRKSWLDAYTDYLKAEGFITDDVSNHIIETSDSNGNITLKWADETDPNEDAHNSILARMTERINDFTPHNNGFPLGMYPNYTEKGEGGFKILPNKSNSPTEHTMRETFYNHLVKADRTITAVLKKQEDPTFDVSRILQLSDGAKNRGSSATKKFAFDSIDKYDEDYEYHNENGTAVGGKDDPLTHGSSYPNIQSENNAWGWEKETGDSFRGKPQNMVYDEKTGTYSYTWFFQTNSGEGGYYLDAFEVNGIPVTIPFYPKYNWKDSYVFQNGTDKADEKHPYYTEVTLADGAILRLEFLLGWGSSTPQRHYRITVTGARSNVVVTGLNLMTGNGAPEFVTYNLVGVYSDQDGYSQTAPAIEYYSKKNNWTRKAQANVIVDSDNLGIYYDNGDSKYHGANIRFKITTGYGNPYYMWTNRHGDVIEDQSSVELDDEGNITSYNSLKYLSDVAEGTQLDSRFIYDGGDGYYYIRVTTQKDYRFALLTLVARTIKYTVRYTPDYDNGTEIWNGFVLDSKNGLEKLTQDWMDNHPKKNGESSNIDIDNMPYYVHNPKICNLWEMAKDSTGNVPQEYQDILHQYDDNDGPYYDLIFNTMATIASDSYGAIRPKDKNKNYTFQNWILVGEDFTPVKDENDNYIQFLGGAIDLTKYSDYAVKHVAFGNADTDIHVLRLMPVWKHIENPFTYNVVLNWVDNLGQLHIEDFSEYWDEVVTEMTVSGQVYVFLNKDAKPLRDWIANHPTYTFWNDVNNATTKEEIEKALKEYIENGGDNDNYDTILEFLSKGTNIDDEEPEWSEVFERLGKDVFIVKKDGGEISIWMYEDKAGLVFRKEVKEEPFIPDDEFYFTITNARVGENYESPLTGKYKAYPQFVYDEDGNPRDRTDDDAWLVEFKDGEIVSIDGDAKVTYFTLQDGDGIALYVSDGQYTVTELGSKSGNSYRTSVTYASTDGSEAKEDWIIPEDGQLLGSEKSVNNSKEGIKQVSATVNFEIGEQNVVQTLTFTNSTLSMRINCEVMAPAGNALWKHSFGYQLKFTLPAGETPLQDAEGNYYYNVTAYRKTVDKDGNIKHIASSGKLRMMPETQTDAHTLGNFIRPFDASGDVWYGALDSNSSAFTLKDNDYYVIVLPAPSDSESTISYTAIETKPTDSETWHLDGEEYSRSGDLKLGVQAVETYVNTVNDPSIYVTKSVVRSDGKQDNNSFAFTVTLSDTTYNDDNFANGVATFSLKDGESKFLVLDIPADGSVTYTVTEESYSDYTTTSTNASGTIIDGSMIYVSFVNTLIAPDSSYLVITETGGNPSETFLYKITYKTTDGEEGELIVSVKGGSSTTISVPTGDYVIEELHDWSWRYENEKTVGDSPQDEWTISSDWITAKRTLKSAEKKEVTYYHKLNGKTWLGGESSNNNVFVVSSSEENKNVSSQYSWFMNIIDSIVQIFR